MKKRITIILSALLLLVIISFFVLNAWIASDVKERIQLVQLEYEGSAEDALIAYLLDEKKSVTDRTHIAIWTLGRIRSEKALPILKNLYQNDPKGETCKGKHDIMLCQYEIYKAIWAIEKGWIFSQARFNK